MRLVRIIRPIVVIRFCGLNVAIIEHVPPDVEFFLCEIEAGDDHEALDLFYYASPICNTRLKRMIGHNLSG